MRTRLPGKDLIMKHTPYGYDIVGGAAVINEEQAANLRKLCENYLSGICFKGVHDYVSPNDDRMPSISEDSEWKDDWEEE